MKGDKTQVFSSRSDYMEANRVEKRSIITICKYLVINSISGEYLPPYSVLFYVS